MCVCVFDRRGCVRAQLASSLSLNCTVSRQSSSGSQVLERERERGGGGGGGGRETETETERDLMSEKET